MNVDTACSSSLEALCLAVDAINTGRCEAALVGGVNILLDPQITRLTYKLRMLSPDGACKSFDQSGTRNAFVRGPIQRVNFVLSLSLSSSSSSFSSWSFCIPMFWSSLALGSRALRSSCITCFTCVKETSYSVFVPVSMFVLVCLFFFLPTKLTWFDLCSRTNVLFYRADRFTCCFAA